METDFIAEIIAVNEADPRQEQRLKPCAFAIFAVFVAELFFQYSGFPASANDLQRDEDDKNQQHLRIPEHEEDSEE
jgi:hypothetical protein